MTVALQCSPARKKIAPFPTDLFVMIVWRSRCPSSPPAPDPTYRLTGEPINQLTNEPVNYSGKFIRRRREHFSYQSNRQRIVCHNQQPALKFAVVKRPSWQAGTENSIRVYFDVGMPTISALSANSASSAFSANSAKVAAPPIPNRPRRTQRTQQGTARPQPPLLRPHPPANNPPNARRNRCNHH